MPYRFWNFSVRNRFSSLSKQTTNGIRSTSSSIRLAEKCNLPDPEEMKRVVWERESQRSTGIGQGLAIPHGKSQYLKNLIMAIGIIPEGIEFESIDQKPVKMIALLLSPSDRIAEHIQALGRISRLMNDETFRGKAYGARNSEDLYEQIRVACS